MFLPQNLQPEEMAALKETLKDVLIRDPKGREVFSFLLYTMGFFSYVTELNKETHNYAVELMRFMGIEADFLKDMLAAVLDKWQ